MTEITEAAMYDGYLVFDCDFLDIPFQDMPEFGWLIVCHDPQKRLGNKTWSVVCASEYPEDGIPPTPVCLCWKEDDAVNIAHRLCQMTDPVKCKCGNMPTLREQKLLGLGLFKYYGCLCGREAPFSSEYHYFLGRINLGFNIDTERYGYTHAWNKLQERIR